MILAATDLSLALAAIPTSLAAIVVGWLTYQATRRAEPAVAVAAQIEPRVTELEDRSAGWLAALQAKDELIATLRAELAACRDAHRAGPGTAD